MLHKIWQKIQLWMWFVLALTSWFFALGFWAVSSKTEEVIILAPTSKPETQQQLQPQTLAATNDLGMLKQQVTPLKLSERFLASSEHEAEFRGTKFIKDNINAYTIELFRVTNEAVVVNFLKSKANRDLYYYFRLTRPQQNDSFVVVYGVYSSETEANNVLAAIHQGIKIAYKAQVRPFKQYESEVNDLGSDELSAKIKLDSVRLIPVAVTPAVIPPLSIASEFADPNGTVTTQTTVTQLDAKGNVVAVEQSKTRVVEPNIKPENEAVQPKSENRSEQGVTPALPKANN